MMSNEEILGKLNEIFQDIFDDESIQLTAETSPADIEDWDSMAQINMLVAIEDEFQIKIHMDEAVSLDSIRKIMELIAKKRSSAKKE